MHCVFCRIGDAVLQLVVSEGLLSRYTTASIGELSKMRSAMIDRGSCHQHAKQLGLQRFLVVGNAIDSGHSGNLSSRVFTSNIMAELFEAVLGAIYVDTDMHYAHTWFACQVKWPVSLTAASVQFSSKGP